MKLLILGGTAEAFSLSDAIAGDRRFSAVLSLAGRTRQPRLPTIPCRIGGFGGPDGLESYLRETGTAVLVDATHPFAVRISANAVAAAARARVSLLALMRPAWVPGDGDRWTSVPDLRAAAALLGAEPRRVLLTVGRQELAPFRDSPWHSYVVRSVDAPAPSELPPRCTVITARGPFTEPDERRLLMEHGVEVIVTKNSGGEATRAKLHAARALGLPVLMAQRPTPPRASTVGAVSDVLAFLAARHSDWASGCLSDGSGVARDRCNLIP